MGTNYSVINDENKPPSGPIIIKPPDSSLEVAKALIRGLASAAATKENFVWATWSTEMSMSDLLKQGW